MIQLYLADFQDFYASTNTNSQYTSRKITSAMGVVGRL